MADAGQLLAVRVGVRLLGAHAMPSLSWWVRRATQSGSRTGTGGSGLGGWGVHDAPAGARRGDGVGQDDDGLTGVTAPDPRLGEADLVGRPVAQSLPRSQPHGTLWGECGEGEAWMPWVRPYVRSDGTPVRGHSRWAAGGGGERAAAAVHSSTRSTFDHALLPGRPVAGRESSAPRVLSFRCRAPTMGGAGHPPDGGTAVTVRHGWPARRSPTDDTGAP